MASRITLDSSVFKDTSISTQTSSAVKALEAMLSKAPPIHEIDVNDVRRSLLSGSGPLAAEKKDDNASWKTVAVNGDEVRLREFLADDPRGVYLHMHPGGFCFGGADFQDQTLKSISEELNVSVLSVDYRLAPENPWPAAAVDCEAAALWLIDNAMADYGVESLVIGGESAGAYYAAITLLRVRDRLGDARFKAVNLAYGPYDMSMGPALRNWGNRNLILNTDICAYFGDMLLPPARWSLEDRRDGSISPLFADLSALPPALFSVGTLDPMIDDSIFMASRWLANGNDAKLDIYPGGVHLFDKLPTDIANQYRESLIAFFDEHLN
ncbi:MAG: alpha/beta hydrolase fold domain-containing protein [Pseudomonadota bacterium]